MRIHEYQAKKLFRQQGIKTPNSVLVTETAKAQAACAMFNSDGLVVKAQVHAGGRGKGGGVVVCNNHSEAQTACIKLLNTNLVTPQTNSKGLPVDKVLVEDKQDIVKELYLGLLIDRKIQKIIILASADGGADIEQTAKENPNKVIKYALDVFAGIDDSICAEIACKLNLDRGLAAQFKDVLTGLYKIFTDKDASLVEINPLIITTDNSLLALDGKIEFDDNALYRNDDIVALRDHAQENPKEILASEYKLSYISLDGNIGCMVNGAGLAMATMDLIEHYGGAPANFLDVGGSTTADSVAKAFDIIQSGASVDGILVNIFGGIVRCDLIAEGIIQAVKNVGLSVPIVVRLEGTNSVRGLEILAKSQLNIHTEPDLTQAAKTIIKLTTN